MRAPQIPKTEHVSPSGAALLIGVYQKYISPVDGQRCAMQPSCSHFAADSIERYGWFKGVLMGTDRIMRCGMDSRFYPHQYRDYRSYNLDPPEESIWAEGK